MTKNATTAASTTATAITAATMAIVLLNNAPIPILSRRCFQQRRRSTNQIKETQHDETPNSYEQRHHQHQLKLLRSFRFV